MTAASAAPRVRGGRAGLYAQGLATGAVAMLARPSALLGLALLLPGLLAWFNERSPGRPAARCMLLFGAAGALPSLVSLWNGPGGLDAALALALDPHALALAWAAQAGGWLVAECLPAGARLLADAGGARRIRRLRLERDRLAEEWGEEAGTAQAS